MLIDVFIDLHPLMYPKPITPPDTAQGADQDTGLWPGTVIIIHQFSPLSCNILIPGIFKCFEPTVDLTGSPSQTCFIYYLSHVERKTFWWKWLPHNYR